MAVGALVDAGADPAAIASALDSLGIQVSVSFEKVKRGGMAATKFHVTYPEQKAHRHLGPILRMIAGAALPDAVKDSASRVFQRLGEAEAHVHGIGIEKVHFHEVGAADSIADIVGACLALDLLGVNRLFVSPVNTGSGTVNTEHGVLPVPAPATAELLKGRPVYASGPVMELTTPTGAALAATLAEGFGPMPPMSIAATGFGAGSKETPGRANVLRALIGTAADAAESTEVYVIEANIDDASPQVLAYAVERLLDAGALDATLQPLEMKKGRPGSLLSVIARPEDREALCQILFAETTTLGVRFHRAERRVQPRHWEEVETPHGTVRVKTAGPHAYAPEYEDCRRLARETGVPLRQILAEANYAFLKKSR